MYKKRLMLLALTVLAMQFSSALCTLTSSLISQDPVSAVPGETVKVIFQLEGVENPECGQVTLEFIEEYPFSLDPGSKKTQTIQSGTYVRDSNSFWIIPYKIRVDKDALDGDQKVSLKTSVAGANQFSKIHDFNLTVKEVRTDFIVTLDSYSFSTNKLVIGVVNTGDKNAEAVTVEIPQQENALVDGGHVKILGELDSNEDTTVSFDAALSSGPIKVNIEYNDEIGERRQLAKEVLFSEIAFESTRAKSSVPIASILLWLAVIGIIVYLYLSRRKAHQHIRRLTRNNLKSYS